MRKLLLTAVALTGISAPAFAEPDGIEGRDWARMSFTIQSNAKVKVTAYVTTKNAHNGNKSSVQIRVNGVAKKVNVADAAQTSSEYIVSGKGDYAIEVICSNERADADTCGVDAKAVEGGIF